MIITTVDKLVGFFGGIYIYGWKDTMGSYADGFHDRE
jgi:hypothetical protein